MKKIIFVHLLNDFSGSPLVLSQVIRVCAENNYAVELYTGNDGDGFLSNVAERPFTYSYKRFGNRYLTLISYLFSQCILFFKLLKYRGQKVSFYINTMLPFGAGLAGKLLGKRVIYHLHETSVTPPTLKSFLKKIIKITSCQNVFVSKYLQQAEGMENVKSVYIHNALPESFTDKSLSCIYQPRHSGLFRVLMICSLKRYKGIDELFEIAERLTPYKDICFVLVLNAEQKEVDHYFKGKTPPGNIEILANQPDVAGYYQQASIVLNLSRVDEWVETFGLTILEAMTFGVPCIVPPVGGPTELVDDGVEGYLISSYEGDAIAEKIVYLSRHPEKCLELSHRAREKAKQFSYKQFAQKILQVING